MHVLFVHSNFPAQFRYLAPRLARSYGWRCSFVTRNLTAPDVPGVGRIPYRRRGGATLANHPCTRYFERTVRDAHGVYEAMKSRPDIKPDLVVAHSGFGSRCSCRTCTTRRSSTSSSTFTGPAAAHSASGRRCR